MEILLLSSFIILFNLVIFIKFETISNFFIFFDKPDGKLKKHKDSVSIIGGLIILLNLYVLYLLRKTRFRSIIINSIMLLIFAQIFTGIIMYYLDFPFSSQPLHLLLSTIIIGLQFYFLMLYKIKSYEVKI